MKRIKWVVSCLSPIEPTQPGFLLEKSWPPKQFFTDTHSQADKVEESMDLSGWHRNLVFRYLCLFMINVYIGCLFLGNWPYLYTFLDTQCLMGLGPTFLSQFFRDLCI